MMLKLGCAAWGPTRTFDMVLDPHLLPPTFPSIIVLLKWGWPRGLMDAHPEWFTPMEAHSLYGVNLVYCREEVYQAAQIYHENARDYAGLDCVSFIEKLLSSKS